MSSESIQPILQDASANQQVAQVATPKRVRKLWIDSQPYSPSSDVSCYFFKILFVRICQGTYVWMVPMWY